MNFFAYVIAWTIILSCFAIVVILFNNLIVFLRDCTPLGEPFRKNKVQEIVMFANFVVDEMENRKIDEVYHNGNFSDVKEGD